MLCVVLLSDYFVIVIVFVQQRGPVVGAQRVVAAVAGAHRRRKVDHCAVQYFALCVCLSLSMCYSQRDIICGRAQVVSPELVLLRHRAPHLVRRSLRRHLLSRRLGARKVTSFCLSLSLCQFCLLFSCLLLIFIVGFFFRCCVLLCVV